MSGKKVQVGRRRMLEEPARPTWEAASAGPKEKPEARRAETRQKVEKINAPAPVTQRKLRVAAYARVSTDLDSQETSIENQCDHYKSLIEAKNIWKDEKTTVSNRELKSMVEFYKKDLVPNYDIPEL